MAHGIDGIDSELAAQRDLLLSREPPYARALELLTETVRGEFGARLAATWKHRSFNAFYERPLLLLAALRYDALHEGASHPLHAAFTASAPKADGVSPEALASAMAPGRTRFYDALRDRAVQTNETTRAVTWLWPLRLLAEAGERRPVALVDMGSSAGLNLIADELPAPWTDGNGAPLAIEPRPPVSLRLGFDISPLDVRSDDAATWLRACVWPSDTWRLDRLEQGITRFRASAARADGPRLEACALPDAPARVAVLPPDVLVVCMQTIVRDYLSDADRERYERGMHAALRERPPLSTLWAELELHPGGGSFERAAAIIVRFVDPSGADRELLLAHTHPHPKQVFPYEEATAELAAAFGSNATGENRDLS
jgi:hypothetical protein